MTLTVPLLLDYSKAVERLRPVVKKTPLAFSHNLSRRYGCEVFLKREDLQLVRSYKLRGAYNMMSSLPEEQLQKGVVCASAGNHAQGVAYSCKKTACERSDFHACYHPTAKNTTNTLVR